MSEKTLNRDDILNALDLPTDLAPAPRWGGEVLVRAMPVGNLRYTTYLSKGATAKNPISPREEFTRRMTGCVILCALDPETEKPMFGWNDANALRDKHWNTTVSVANKAFELAGTDDDVADDAAIRALATIATYAEEQEWGDEDTAHLAAIDALILKGVAAEEDESEPEVELELVTEAAVDPADDDPDYQAEPETDPDPLETP